MKHSNHLNSETSPYLLQHAHNPVNWYPWCDEAFQRAVKEDKPVFLSIGYSTCHWCHVMAEETFENEKAAKLLNAHFISIKVDREERPDIDNIYMRACQLMTGSGGWPMSVFLTPEKSPFFAGTYFPRHHFMELAQAIAKQWHSDKEKLLDAAENISIAMEEVYEKRSSGNPVYNDENADALEKMERTLLRESLAFFLQSFDAVNGGFGRAPKFPSPHNSMLLLAHSPHMAEKTLLQMFKGGIFDHIGGGFSRYSTDERWLAPHFEKMLYDNALLAITYTLAFAKTGNSFYSYVAKRTLSYLCREMLSDDGGFYSAQDADTDGKEGKFYLFTSNEIEDVLGKDAASDFCRRFDIRKGGNFEGKSIPNLLLSEKDTDVEHSSLIVDRVCAEDIQNSIEKLYYYRQQRLSLHRDEKQLTGWNCLAAAAFAFAGRIFEDESLVSIADDTLAFIEAHLLKNDVLHACYAGGRKSGPAFLDDYAFYALALIQMYKALCSACASDGNSFTDSASRYNAYLRRAVAITEKTIENFWDERDYGFFFSGKDNEKLIMDVKECYDGAIPSGNSVMAYVLTQLIALMENSSDDIEPTDRRADTLSSFKETLKRHRLFMNQQAGSHPAGHSFYLFSLSPLKEITCENGMCSLTGEDVF